MIADLTPKQKRKLLDSRCNQDALMPFFIKWVNVSNSARPSHITDMLKRFADMSTTEQANWYVNPITDELTYVDIAQSRVTYTKTQKHGWTENRSSIQSKKQQNA